jgi:tRNA(fMet)-specific endonuclease VapC
VIRYLVDTNILGYFSRGTPGPLIQRMTEALNNKEAAISVITRAETMFGLARLGPADKRRRTLKLILDEFPCLDWTAEAADRYGDIAAALADKGKPIGQMDTLIAAHALAAQLVVVTHNTRHFKLVPGLTIEDWTQDIQP